METFSTLLALCVGNSPVTGEFTSQRPLRRSFDVFVDLSLNKQLSKQSWGWWFELPSRSLQRVMNHCKHIGICMCVLFVCALVKDCIRRGFNGLYARLVSCHCCSLQPIVTQLEQNLSLAAHCTLYLHQPHHNHNSHYKHIGYACVCVCVREIFQ